MKLAAAVLVLFAFVAGCERDRGRPTPAKPVPPPPALLVSLSLPSVDAGLAGVRQFAEAIQQGASIMMQERLLLGAAKVGALDGVAGDKPVHVLLVAPDQHEKPMAVVVAVRDGAKLRASAKAAGAEVREASGHAILGDKAVVALLGDWALSALPSSKPPAVPTVTGYSAALLAKYRPDIEQAGAKLKAQMAAVPGASANVGEIFDFYVKAAILLLESSERLELRLEAGASNAALVAAVVGKPDSKLATFIAAQRPTDFALLSRLPAGDPSVVVAGKMLLGPLRDDALALFSRLMVTFLRAPVSDELNEFMKVWADTATGDIAMTMSMAPGRMQMTQLVGIDDPAKVNAAIRAFVKSLGGKPLETSNFGVTSRYTVSADATTIEGVAFHRYTAENDTSGMPPEQAAAAALMGTSFVGLIGAWDDVAGVSFGGDEAGARALLAASRGQGARIALSPRVTGDLVDARARKDSVYYFIDFGRLLSAMAPAGKLPFTGPLGMAMTFGFAERTAQLRIAVTSSEIKAIAAAAQAAKAGQAPQ